MNSQEVEGLIARLKEARANGDPEKYMAFVTVADAHRIAELLSVSKQGDGRPSSEPASGKDLGMGDRVNRLRMEHQLTLQALSDRCGLTKSWIWEIEQGRQKNPTINSAVALARALGVSLDYLTGLSTTRPDLHPEALRIAIEVDNIIRSPALRASQDGGEG